MEVNEKYGQLLNSNMKLHRQYFREMVKLLGIYAIYRAPLPNKHYTTYAEIDTNYADPIKVGCILHDHPDQRTLKKMGWMSELGADSILIEVDYDLPDLQQGAIFILPSGLDDGKGRLFRVVRLSNSMVSPASITCEIVPEYVDSYNKATSDNYENSSFNLLDEEPCRLMQTGGLL